MRRDVIGDSKDRSTLPFQVIAGFEAVALSLGFWWWIHYLFEHAKGNPNVNALFPLSGLAYLCSVLPLVMYIVYASDFEGVNPLNPVHLLFLARKFYSALQ